VYIDDESLIKTSAYKVVKLSAATGTTGVYRGCGSYDGRTDCVAEPATATITVTTCYCNTTMCNGEFDFTRISQRR